MEQASELEPVIPHFYAGRCVFITGATGFMGKVLVERLLSTCPDVQKLYLLMRAKRGLSPHERLLQLKQAQIFDNIRAQCPCQLDKMRVVDGDVTLPYLGLDELSVQRLEQVSVVFHSAATIKFWEPLGSALTQNVSSVQELLKISDKLPNLKALIHVSTAFSNAELSDIEEKVYGNTDELARVQAVVDSLPAEIIDDITARYISPKPNTYVYSKAVAESVIEEHSDRRYAISIFRPSIVISTHKNPYPGWVENMGGPSGSIVGCGKGLLRVFYVDDGARADLIPVDIAIDTLMAVGWETAVDHLSEVRVYHSCSQDNPLTWGKFRREVIRNVIKHPFDNALYYPYTFGTQNLLVFKILAMLLQTAPLYFAEYICKLCEVKIKINLGTVAQRQRTMHEVLSFFTMREWTFRVDNVSRLRQRLTEADMKIYNLDIRAVNWEEHLENFVKGTRKFLLSEKDENLPQARKHIARLRVLHHLVLLMLAVLFYRVVMFASAVALQSVSSARESIVI